MSVRHHLIRVRDDGMPILCGPYPTGEQQKLVAREMMQAGCFMMFLDVDSDRTSVGLGKHEPGKLDSRQRVEIKVFR